MYSSQGECTRFDSKYRLVPLTGVTPLLAEWRGPRTECAAFDRIGLAAGTPYC